MRLSPEFRKLWPRQDVLRSLSSHKRIQHPIAGRMTFEYSSFAVTGSPDMKLVVYTPLSSDRTAEKLDSLLVAASAQAGRQARPEPSARNGERKSANPTSPR
jgi:hypothetical protein